MAIIQDIESKKSIALSGLLGRPNGIGLIKCGWSKLGDFFPHAGIFRRDGRWHTQRVVKMVHYRPTNNQLPYQQFWRDYFRNSVAIYHALTDEITDSYKQMAKKYRMTGYNYFISQYSVTRPAHNGNYRLGWTKLGVLTTF